MNYLDTSALVKRFVAERGSPLVHDLVVHKGPIACSKVAYAETYAGLTRKKREGHLTKVQYQLACRQFEEDWQSYIRLELTDDVLRKARYLIQRHLLRGFDAIHLASAFDLMKSLGEPVTFVATDVTLLNAADAENMPILNVELNHPE